jgi:beta-phosphoglucomutase-like phosphatase (HAD superfamily)
MPRTIASSSHTDTIRENLHMSDLEKYFPQYVGGNQVRSGKPDPEIYLKAASVLEIDPSACIVLEDSGPGIRAAHAAGMIPIMIPDIVQPSEEIRKLTHRIFRSLLEAKEYLKDCL